LLLGWFITLQEEAMHITLPTLTALVLSAGATLAFAGPSETVMSPNGKVEISFRLGEKGGPLYDVSFGGRPIVADSALGLTLRARTLLWRTSPVADPLTAGFKVLGVRRATHDEEYAFIAGKTQKGRNRCAEMTVALEQGGEKPRRLDIVFRACDDGAAFRYVLPEQDGLGDVDLMSEDSQFRFLDNHEAWVLQLPAFETNSEGEFLPTALLAIEPESIVGPPLTIELGGGLTVAIAESKLVDYSGMYLGRVEDGDDSRHPVLVTKLAPLPSDPGVCVRGATPLETPWRVLMIGDRPGALVESTLLWDLADPSRIEDTSWIKPGKVAWDWWSGPYIPNVDFEVGMNDTTFRHFIDFAAEFGLEYVLIDAEWYGSHRSFNADITTSILGMDIPGLVAYGAERNVGILLWLNWQNLRNVMDEAFPLYEKWGVKGVKVDYMNRKDQEIVAFYHNVLRMAAKHHLVVDFHGAYAGSGEERTWPNLLTREGVMGLEHLKWSSRVTPRHNVTLPFTRMLLGPMDYTPGGFRSVSSEAFKPRMKAPLVLGTRAHHLAMYVVYESPLQMLVDYPAAYRGQPGAEFLKLVPASWEETRVLDGRIGEYIVVARRKGKDWFIGAMTDAPRSLPVSLADLGGGPFEATIYADTAESTNTPTELGVSKKLLEGSSSLTLEMARGGGTAIHLRLER
jgi:alpha-glucosidase